MDILRDIALKELALEGPGGEVLVMALCPKSCRSPRLLQ